jgi:hypothetical protein
MPNDLFQYNWNTLNTPKPSDGSNINWTNQPGNPGLKPTIDQFTDEFKALYNNLDADTIGKGVKYENLANRSTQAVNTSPTVYRNNVIEDLRRTYDLSSGSYVSTYSQVTGQATNFLTLSTWQLPVTFRNFQTGLDNIVTENIVDLEYRLLSSSDVPAAQIQNVFTWNETGTAMAGVNNLQGWKQATIGLQVSSSSSFSTYSMVEKSLLICSDGTSVNKIPHFKTFSLWETSQKNYQNPWYRLVFFLKQRADQPAGLTMTLPIQLIYSVQQKVTNRTI